MRFLLSIIGIAALVIGLFWCGQGLGYIRWPAESFMISQAKWTYYGAGLAFVGLILILFSRR